MASSSSTKSVINETSVDSTASSSISTKYGDADLTSKRRKLHPELLLSLPDEPDDDYLTFNKKISFETCLNSTFLKTSDLIKSPRSEQDFKGGLLTEHLCAKQPTSIQFIAKSPSGTSCGFENTFRILEQQIRSKNDSRKFLRRISEEYVPSLTSFIGDTCSISSSRRSDTESEDDYENPSLLELELEAMQRVKEHLKKTKPDLFSRLNEDAGAGAGAANASIDVTTPINDLLYGFHPTTTGLNDITLKQKTDEKSINETIQDLSGDYPEYVYHVAKGKDGRMYLKVVRSLLIDKVLCGNRVSQMTRAYDDIEAVTRLLEEKEKDLELTVQIGKELLTQNNRLESRVAELEAELKTSNEDRAQLIHDLHQKNELISILSNDVDDGSENGTPTVSKSINLDLLQRKIANLQDENKSLKQEASQLAKGCDEVEEQERKLMEDITTQLNSAHSQFDGINLELERQKEENRLQHEQIVSLTARLAEAEMRLHQLTAENDEQVSMLSITKENQNMLTTELAEFKARYQEVLSLLQEAQELLRKQRKKSQPHARSSFIPGLGIPQQDSLQSELMETSLYSENSLDSGISADRLSSARGGVGGHLPPYGKVFETVRSAHKNGHYSDGMSHLGAMALSSSSQPRMSALPYLPSSGAYHRPSSVYSGSTYPSYESSSLGIKTMSCESLTSQSDDGYPANPSGVPGAPGAKDLEAALKRLTPAEVLARRAMLAHAPAGTYTYEENQSGMPLGIRTPDSIMSTGSSSALSNMSSNQWRLPEKLQIVKPMEGSQTLHHWSRLATPTLSGLLEERPGVTIRGGRGLDELGMQVYSLSDVEEDMDDHPGKQFQPSGCIYTFTNSTVLHPDDGTIPLTFSLPQSQMSSRMASNSTSRQPSCPPTPRAGLSRRNSCSTFSVNMGLASMLNERGIKAVTPSALNTPAGPNFTPTCTPCNSPEGSPTRSMSPEPLFGILSSGAELIRRKLIGEVDRPTRTQTKQQKIMLSRLEKRALRSLRLLEKVESIGLENIISTQPNAMTQLASGIASRSASPMAQLTSLKNLQQHGCGGSSGSSVSSLDDVQFNRDQIRAVLSKGLSNDSLKSLIDSDSGSSVGGSSSSDMSDNLHSTPKSSRSTFDNIRHHQQAKEQKLLQQQQQQQLQKQQHPQHEQMQQPQQAQISTAPPTTPDIRTRQMQRQKSRRSLKNGIGGQRPDLGTVGGRVRPDLGKISGHGDSSRNDHKSHSQQQLQLQQLQKKQEQQQRPEKQPTQSMTQSFVGSISSLFFGRKGGLL